MENPKWTFLANPILRNEVRIYASGWKLLRSGIQSEHFSFMWLLQGTRPSTLGSGAHASFSVSVRQKVEICCPLTLSHSHLLGVTYLKLAISLQHGPKKQPLTVLNQRNTVMGSSLGKNKLGVWRQNHAVYSRNLRNYFKGIFANSCVSLPLLTLDPPPLHPHTVKNWEHVAHFLCNCSNSQPLGHFGQLQLGMLSLQGLTLFIWPVWTHHRCRCDF